MQSKKTLFFLILLTLFAFAIRVYKIDTLPLGVHPDEASWGYNAYSIIETGKDEHGTNYPLIFKAFGDQKLPVFTYALVPFIKVFGLNNLAVRLPAAIIGTLTVVVVFFILKQFKFSDSLSLLGVLIAATSPWFIFLSRVFSPDSTFGLFFYSLGILLALKAYRQNKGLYFFLAAFCFAATLYSYIAYRLITPLTIISFLLIFQRTKRFVNKQALLMLASFFLMILPLLFLSFSGSGTARFKQVFSTPMIGMIMEINENRYFCTQKLPRFLCNLNDNKLKSYVQTLGYRYLKTLSPEYLFLEGDKESKFLNVTKYGMFYYILLPLYFGAFFYFGNRLLQKRLNRSEVFVLSGLIIAPISALLVNEPGKTRLSGLSIFMVSALVYGAYFINTTLKKKNYQIIFYCFSTILILLYTTLFLIDFLVIHLHKNEFFYQNHNTKLVKYLGQQDKQTQIYIRGIDEAIVLYAYLNKVDPQVYQTKVKRQPTDDIGFAHASDLLNIHITKMNINDLYCQTKSKNQTVLYATNDNLIGPQYFKKAKKIIYSEDKTYKLQYVYDLRQLLNKEQIRCQ